MVTGTNGPLWGQAPDSVNQVTSFYTFLMVTGTNGFVLSNLMQQGTKSQSSFLFNAKLTEI